MVCLDWVIKMERWNLRNYKRERSDKVNDFLDEILHVCMEFDLSLSHEDRHGAFIVEPHTQETDTWIKNAHMDLDLAVIEE